MATSGSSVVALRFPPLLQDALLRELVLVDLGLVGVVGEADVLGGGTPLLMSILAHTWRSWKSMDGRD